MQLDSTILCWRCCGWLKQGSPTSAGLMLQPVLPWLSPEHSPLSQSALTLCGGARASEAAVERGGLEAEEGSVRGSLRRSEYRAPPPRFLLGSLSPSSPGCSGSGQRVWRQPRGERGQGLQGSGGLCLSVAEPLRETCRQKRNGQQRPLLPRKAPEQLCSRPRGRAGLRAGPPARGGTRGPGRAQPLPAPPPLPRVPGRAVGPRWLHELPRRGSGRCSWRWRRRGRRRRPWTCAWTGGWRPGTRGAATRAGPRCRCRCSPSLQPPPRPAAGSGCAPTRPPYAPPCPWRCSPPSTSYSSAFSLGTAAPHPVTRASPSIPGPPLPLSFPPGARPSAASSRPLLAPGDGGERCRGCGEGREAPAHSPAPGWSRMKCVSGSRPCPCKRSFPPALLCRPVLLSLPSRQMEQPRHSLGAPGIERQGRE